MDARKAYSYLQKHLWQQILCPLVFSSPEFFLFFSKVFAYSSCLELIHYSLELFPWNNALGSKKMLCGEA